MRVEWFREIPHSFPFRNDTISPLCLSILPSVFLSRGIVKSECCIYQLTLHTTGFISDMILSTRYLKLNKFRSFNKDCNMHPSCSVRSQHERLLCFLAGIFQLLPLLILSIFSTIIISSIILFLSIFLHSFVSINFYHYPYVTLSSIVHLHLVLYNSHSFSHISLSFPISSSITPIA